MFNGPAKKKNIFVKKHTRRSYVKWSSCSRYNIKSRKNGHGIRGFFFWGNVTKGVVDSSKGAVTVDSGCRAGAGTFKASKDFARGDVMCAGLCCVSIGCEAISGVLIWCPIPGKIVTVSALKATSLGCQKFRDLCAADPDPSSPLC
jgi:hypothetical protein